MSSRNFGYWLSSGTSLPCFFPSLLALFLPAFYLTSTVPCTAEEESDLNTLLASKAAQRNGRSWDGKPSASVRPASRAVDSDKEDGCNLASSSDSEKGKGGNDGGDECTPMPAGRQGPTLRHSLSLGKGERRRWSPEASTSSLNRWVPQPDAVLGYLP